MWSRKHDRCIKCSTQEKPHYGFGLCKKCYQDRWVEENPEKVKRAKTKYYIENRDTVILRSQINKNGVYGVTGKRVACCSFCGSTEYIQCHHVDRHGHNVETEKRNNDPSNIQFLCRSCHGSMHGKQAKGIPKRKSKQCGNALINC